MAIPSWGQGINDANKLSTLVSNRLATYLSAQGISVDLHVFAHSGATVWPDSTDANPPSWGEVPVSAPCILTQLATAGSQFGVAAKQPCLVLVDGGINDVKVSNILTIDPTISDKPAWITKITTQDFGSRIPDLLTHVFNTFPQAFVIITSYYQIVSQHSLGVQEAEAALSVFVSALFPGVPFVISQLMNPFAAQCGAFAQASLSALSTAVTSFNATLGKQRVFLAVPPFGPQNSVGAEVPYLWLGSNDPLANQRKSWYLNNLSRGLVLCPVYTPIASICHPNIQGARVYANAINRQLAWFIRQLAPFPRPISQFLPNEDWTGGPFWGSRGTFFADVDGDGRADAIAVNDDGVYVRLSTGSGFPGPAQNWTGGPYYSLRTQNVVPSDQSVYFADVNGDGMADAIVVNDDAVYVRLSTGFGFGPAQNWTGGPYYGNRGTFFADVNGDGMADAIVVNDDAVHVRLSTGSGFPDPAQNWTGGPYYSTRTQSVVPSDQSVYFVDVDGNGMADAIVVNNDTVTVRRSNGTQFLPNENWTGGPYYGSRGTFFADVDGNGMADAIVVNDLPTNSTVTVRRSNGTQFLPSEDWTHGPYWGSVGNAAYFVDVTGDGCADAIVVNNLPTNSTVTVRRAG